MLELELGASGSVGQEPPVAYRMHDLFRALARKNLNAPLHEAAPERHASGFLDFSRVACIVSEESKDVQQQIHMLRFFWPDIQEAHHWIMSRTEPTEAQAALVRGYANVGADILVYWMPSGERLDWYSRTADACGRIGDEALEQAARRCRATASAQIGRSGEARQEFARSLRVGPSMRQ